MSAPETPRLDVLDGATGSSLCEPGPAVQSRFELRRQALLQRDMERNVPVKSSRPGRFLSNGKERATG